MITLSPFENVLVSFRVKLAFFSHLRESVLKLAPQLKVTLLTFFRSPFHLFVDVALSWKTEIKEKVYTRNI